MPEYRGKHLDYPVSLIKLLSFDYSPILLAGLSLLAQNIQGLLLSDDGLVRRMTKFRFLYLVFEDHLLTV